MQVRSLGALSVGILLIASSAQLKLSPTSLHAQAPPRDRPLTEAPTGTARLRGQIVAADTGTPLRRAQVRAIANAIRTTRLTSTDSEGRYEFLNLPAGRYTISVSKAGYVGLEFGQRRPFEGGRPLDIADGEIAERIDFALPRGSVIAGRLTDDAGDPIIGAWVQAMRYQYAPGGRRRLLSVNGAGWFSNTTNDLGEFRIFGLMPGTYLLSANHQHTGVVSLTPPTSQTGGISSLDARDGFIQTYFPGTPSAAEAQPVIVNLAEEVQASFSLMTGRMSNLSGIVRRSDGRAAAGMNIDLRPNDPTGEGATGWGSSTVATDGSFSFANVPPGDYVLEVATRRQPIDINTGAVMREGSGPSETPEFARVRTTISGIDVTGMSITTRPGITVSGRIVMQAKPNAVNPLRIRIGAASADSDSQTVGSEIPRVFTVADENGRFQLRDVAGVVLFRPFALPGQLVLNAVHLNGVDITDRPYDASSGDVGGLEVVIVEQAQLNGTARNSRGEAVRDFRVALFPAGATPGAATMRFMHTGSSDPKGGFQILRLPAGEYLGVALESFDRGQEWDPAFQKRVLPLARRFTLKEGQALAIELPFVE